MEASNSFSALDHWVHVQERGKEKGTGHWEDRILFALTIEPVRSSIMSFSIRWKKLYGIIIAIEFF